MSNKRYYGKRLGCKPVYACGLLMHFQKLLEIQHVLNSYIKVESDIRDEIGMIVPILA